MNSQYHKFRSEYLLTVCHGFAEAADDELVSNGYTSKYRAFKENVQIGLAWAQVHATLANVIEPVSFDDIVRQHDNDS